MKRFLLPAFILCLVSCEKYDFPGMIKGSSPSSDERFAVSKAYNDANGFRSFSPDGEEYTFYAATDAHVSTTANGLTAFVNACLSDASSAPFAIFTGDAMDKKNNFNLFLQAVRPLSANGRTLCCTPGNHDLYFGQWTDHIREMKTASYCFEACTGTDGAVAGKDLFISLDSASGTLGTDQRAWLGAVLASAKGRYRHIIIFTHTHFFKRDNSQGHTGNFNLEEGYELASLFSDNGVELVICGHDHHFEDTFFKGVRFVTLAALEDIADERYYYTFNVTPEGISLKSHKLTTHN